jgi:predicted AAA+ superfamily ATPase
MLWQAIGRIQDRAVTRDIAMRHGVRHIKTLKDIAFYVASNCGGKLTYQNMASAYSIGSLHTAKNYLSYLRDAYLFWSFRVWCGYPRYRVVAEGSGRV